MPVVALLGSVEVGGLMAAVTLDGNTVVTPAVTNERGYCVTVAAGFTEGVFAGLGSLALAWIWRTWSSVSSVVPEGVERSAVPDCT